MYNNDSRLTENFNEAVMDVFRSYNNLNYLLLRVKPYNHAGRHQSEKESDALGDKLKTLLAEREISYQPVNGDIDGYNSIVDDILKISQQENNDEQ